MDAGKGVTTVLMGFVFVLASINKFPVKAQTPGDPCTSNPCWNGGNCVSFSTEFTCVCPLQFIGLFCESQSHPQDLVFVTNLIPPGIYVAPTNTFNFTLIPGLDGSHDHILQPIAIDYDPTERMVYWTDIKLSTLNRAFLDGTGVEVLFTDLQNPEGLTLDVGNRMMYWTDTGSDLIERATLDGRERSVVLSLKNTSLEAEPRAIVVDPVDSHLYWTDWGTVPKIERAGTDGSDRRVLIDTGLQWPNGIALDLEGGRLYWGDAYFDRIEYSNLLGQSRTVLVDLSSTDTDLFDIFAYYGFIYWSDWRLSSIQRINASGRLFGSHGSETFTNARGIHIFKGGLRVTCPNDIVHLADINKRSVPVSWTDLSASNPGTPLLWNSNHQPGDVFPVGGITMITYTATDQAGNVTSCNFSVTVTGVGLDCPSNVTTVADPGVLSSNVSWALPSLIFNGPPLPVVFYLGSAPTRDTSDAVGQVCVYSEYQPKYVFGIGTTRVTYRVQGLGTQCHFHVIVAGSCQASTTNDPVHGQLMWLTTRRGTTAESFERCPLVTAEAGRPLAVRNCSIVAPPVYLRWGNHTSLSCGKERNEVTLDQVKNVNVSKGNVNEVVAFLANQTSESSESGKDVEAVSAILLNIVAAGSGDVEVTKLVIKTVNNVIMTTSQSSDSQTPVVNAGSSSAIIQSVETQVALTLIQEGQVSIKQDTIHVEAVSLEPMQVSNGVTFVSSPQQQTEQPSPQKGSLAGTKVTTVVNTSEVPRDAIASIRLPANIVNLTQAGNDNSSQPLRVSFIIYADDTLFKSAWIEVSQDNASSSIRVGGSVVSLTVEDAELVNLAEPLVIQFKAPDINETERNKTAIQCVFWDFDLNDGVGDWSTAGCLLARETNNTVSCNCSHATNFAILVDVKGQRHTDISEEAKRALEIISQVGCVISIISLVITLTVYLAIKKLRSGKSREIFVHFCFSLLLLYIVFLAGVDNAKGSGSGCVFVAALLHYLTLSTMMWMAVEARNLYVSTVKVFPENTPRYMIKACLIAWGSPLIVLTITLAAAHGHYKNVDYCFLEPGLVLYLGLLAPIGLILIHNTITFVLVMRSLLKVREASQSQQISKRLQNAVGISALIGLTWCFGFLAIGGATFTFQLIFCLANSLQGLIIFIMFCIRRKEFRTALAPYTKRICCGRTCNLQVLWRKDRQHDLPMSESVPTSPSTAQTAELSVSGLY